MPIEIKKSDIADCLVADEDVLGFLEELAENMGVSRNLSEHISVARVLRSKTAASPISNDDINAAKNTGRL